MKQIPIGGMKGKGLYAIIDDIDLALVSRFTWHITRKGYVEARVPVKLKSKYNVNGIQIQRLLLWDKIRNGLLVDHINGDKLDNRRENLRLVTMSQSNMNRRNINFKRRQDILSKYKGVWWDRNKWRAAITVAGKKIYLGRFHNEDEAAFAYNKAALLYHGEFACLNKISA